MPATYQIPMGKASSISQSVASLHLRDFDVALQGRRKLVDFALRIGDACKQKENADRGRRNGSKWPFLPNESAMPLGGTRKPENGVILPVVLRPEQRSNFGMVGIARKRIGRGCSERNNEL